jgi:hypothetical protein
MKEITNNKIKPAIGTLTLAMTTVFLENSMDGDEFIFATLCILAAIYILIKKNASRLEGMTIVWVTVLLALGIGFRTELILSIFCFYGALLIIKSNDKYNIITILIIQIVFISIVLSPLLLSHYGLQWPTGSWPEASSKASLIIPYRLLSASYKILFTCFSLPVFIVFCFIFYSAAKTLFNKMDVESRSNKYIIYLSFGIIIINFAAFCYYPAKIDLLLITVPFFIILASFLDKMSCLVFLMIATIISHIFSIDILKHRKFIGLTFGKSYYQTFISEKPRYKFDYLQSVSARRFQGTKNIIILNCWEWDIDYNINRGLNLLSFYLPPQLGNGQVKAYKRNLTGDPDIFLATSCLPDNINLKPYADEGFMVHVDEFALRKSKFFQEAIFKKLPASIEIQGVTFHIFSSTGEDS